MSKRKGKPNSAHARMVRYARAMVHLNHLAVIEVDANQLHTIINWKNRTLVTTNARASLVDCITEVPHRWYLYLGAMNRYPDGTRYLKSAPALQLSNPYLAKDLTLLIEPDMKALLASCNPNHLVGAAWLATPYELDLTEKQADEIFYAFGAWPKWEAA